MHDAATETTPARSGDPSDVPDAGPGRTRRELRPPVLRVLRHVVLPIAVTVVLAVVVSRAVELIHVQTEPWMTPAERWDRLEPRLLVLGAIVTWPFVALVLAVTGSMWATAVLSLAAGGVIAFADHEKMSQRGEPLFPSDIDYLTNARLMFATTGMSPVLGVLAVVLVVAALAAVAVLAWRRRGTRPRAVRLLRWAVRAALGMAAVGGIIVISGFNEPGNALREAYDDIPVTWAEWNQVQNYAQNGFVAGALYNLPAPAMVRPDDYGAERVEEITQAYTALAEDLNAGRQPGALDDTNIVIILGETFTDPTQLVGVKAGEDPIPFTRSLMARTPSGTMLSSGLGGGTANVEFEVLTGMALANFQPQMHAPYPMLVPHHEHFPSVVDRLATTHGTLAIHPYAAGFYRRDVVYPALGFERSTFRDTIGHRDKIGNDAHISDAATYEELLDELRASAAPLLVNVVTMQNHSPYTDLFPDPIEVGGVLSGDRAEQAGHYLRGLRHSDDAMAHLVAELEAMDERTIVLFYGDHLPAMWPEQVQSRNSDRAMRQTLWFVWANFETSEVTSPPVLGPNHLVGRLLAAADAPLTPYDALLAELSQELAADEAGIMLDAEGWATSEDELSPRGRELLEDYRLVQYDLAVGRGYGAEAMLTVP